MNVIASTSPDSQDACKRNVFLYNGALCEALAVLERYGFDVKLVDAYKVKNVPGRKTDVKDCQWLAELHRFGLLSGAFRPDKQIQVLRSYWRHRSTLVEACSTQIHLMQKALEQMNIQLHKVITDITGVTGNQNKIAECDRQIEEYMKTFEHKADANDLDSKSSKNNRTKRRKNQPNFDLRTRLFEMTGVAPKAITATAHKLAKLVYRMLKYDMDYVDSGQQYYENQYRERVIKNLTKRAREMGYVVVCTNTGELVS